MATAKTAAKTKAKTKTKAKAKTKTKSKAATKTAAKTATKAATKSAAKTAAKTKKKKADATAGASDGDRGDSPLLDLSDSAVKKLLKTGKERGYVTYDELNEVLPSEEVSSEKIEDTMTTLSDMGITVVESEDDYEESAEEGSKALTAKSSAVTKSGTKSEPAERTDDPVRMYLREMGTVELLSREGEIAIAKRIEAGREAMIAGLCESPLTFQAIIIWRDELNEGRILLRDIIDLEATYEGPEAKNAQNPNDPNAANQAGEGGEGKPAEGGAPAAAEGGEQPKSEGEDGKTADGEKTAEGDTQDDDDDDDEYENALSLAAMEAELKPGVLETFDNIAATYKKLRRHQDKMLEQHVAGEQGTHQQQKTHDKHRDEIVKAVKSLSLNNARIESLVEQLYAINKGLVGLEGRLMRFADSYGVPRSEFIDEYFGNELDQTWLTRMESKNKKWAKFVVSEQEKIQELREEIHELATGTGLEIPEFRRIVKAVKKGEREARQAKKEMVEANLRLVISIAKK